MTWHRIRHGFWQYTPPWNTHGAFTTAVYFVLSEVAEI